MFALQGMIASDFIIVPVEAGSRYAIDGLDKTVETIEDIADVDVTGGSGRFLRLLINKADRRTAVSKVSIEHIQQSYDGKVFRTVIPINTHIQQAEASKKTVIRHSSKSPGADVFRALAAELLELLDR